MEEEVILWSVLRGRKVSSAKFIRQKRIGNYIVDFYCMKSNLVIELDGGGHFTDEKVTRDRARDEYLKSLGLKILRFSNLEIRKHFNAVTEVIFRNI